MLELTYSGRSEALFKRIIAAADHIPALNCRASADPVEVTDHIILIHYSEDPNISRFNASPSCANWTNFVESNAGDLHYVTGMNLAYNSIYIIKILSLHKIEPNNLPAPIVDIKKTKHGWEFFLDTDVSQGFFKRIDYP